MERGARRYLRFCPDCVEHTKSERGVGAWRMPHQSLSAFVCLRHFAPLFSATTHVSQWLLPEEVATPYRPSLTDREVEAASRLQLLTDQSSLLGHTDPFARSAALRYAFFQRGITPSINRFSAEALNTWFNSTRTAQLIVRRYPAWRMAGNRIVHLLRNRRQGGPLDWQTVWSALLESMPPSLASAEFGKVHGISYSPCVHQHQLWPQLSDKLALQEKLLREAAVCSTPEELSLRLRVTVHTVRKWIRDTGGVVWARPVAHQGIAFLPPSCHHVAEQLDLFESASR